MVRVIGRSWSSIPGFARIILVIQAIAIAVLSGWLYNEYVNNQYLQVYMLSLFQGRGSFLAVIGFGGLVGTALVGILLKAGNILGEIEHLSEKVGNGTDTNTATVSRSAQMPVLKVANREPRSEIGQLHGSLRRWKERSD
ncbi:hypothetical protein AUF78_18005 [archaeon 13_1_20CM_2_51_12]|nr:MAG: hypothetical protein AUF78_18005 [archaeon 13_1_20CM_2_51_12]